MSPSLRRANSSSLNVMFEKSLSSGKKKPGNRTKRYKKAKEKNKKRKIVKKR
jgi:hypothetical protein